METKQLIIKITLLLFYFSILFSHTIERTFAQKQNDNYEEIITEALHGIIIPEYQAKNFYRPSYRTTRAEGYFTPSKNDVLRAEQKFVKYLDINRSTLTFEAPTPLSKDLVIYKRHYVGIILKGEKKIWINFFCEPHDSDSWKRYPILVFGGGNCYFNILYDIKSETFSDLWINALK